MERFVFLSAVQYTNCLSGRTRRLADLLAAMGHDVTFVDMPSVTATLRRIFCGERRSQNSAGVRTILLPPFPGYFRLHRSAAARIWVQLIRRRLIHRIPQLDSATLIVSTPWWLPVIRDLPRRLLCYDYIDHLTVHCAGRPAQVLVGWDESLLRICDRVTTVSEPLRQSLRQRVDPSRIRLIANAVERSWIEHPPDPIPRRQIVGGSARPIAGFLGALFEWVDIELLAAVAARMPEITFALVGPTRSGIDVSRLKALANVRFFPAQPYADVPRWIGAFDVCLIPFKDDIISRCADPIKIYEYLALGKPVVSSVPFASGDDPPPMLIGDSPDAFVRCIRAALCDEHGREARIEFARRHTWDKCAASLLSALAPA